MTSSSSTSGSGSLSSQSVPSSMESGATLPTQDVVDGYFSEPEEAEAAEPGWGKLIPVGRGFELLGECSNSRFFFKNKILFLNILILKHFYKRCQVILCCC